MSLLRVDTGGEIGSLFAEEGFEDELDMRTVLRTLLHTANYRTIEADTSHAPIEARSHKPDLLIVDLGLPDIALVAVSTHQRDLFPQLRWRATVPHGLPERLHPFNIDSRNYLAYVGSVKCVNGVGRAVETATRSQLPLKIADRIVGRELRQLEQQLAPLIHQGASIEFVGEQDADLFGDGAANVSR